MSSLNEIALLILDADGLSADMFGEVIACAMTLSAFSTILILFICEWLFTSVWAQTIMAIVCSFSVGLWIWRSTIHHFKEKENAQNKSS